MNRENHMDGGVGVWGGGAGGFPFSSGEAELCWMRGARWKHAN